MNTKHYLVMSGIVGGIIGSLLTALLVSPATAQRDKFGDIECTSLGVVDKDGKTRVIISADFLDGMNDDNIRVHIIGASGHFGNIVAVYGEDGKSRVILSSRGEDGGRVSVSDGKAMSKSVSLGINEHGGVVQVEGKGQGQAVYNYPQKLDSVLRWICC